VCRVEQGEQTRVRLEGAQREAFASEHGKLARGAEAFEIDDVRRKIGRVGEASLGVGPGALHADLLGREQQHLDLRARERGAPGELLGPRTSTAHAPPSSSAPGLRARTNAPAESATKVAMP
jgi:hypothetical protein